MARNLPVLSGQKRDEISIKPQYRWHLLVALFRVLVQRHRTDFHNEDGGCNIARAAAICTGEMASMMDAPVLKPGVKKIFTATDAQVQEYAKALQNSAATKTFLSQRGITMDVAQRLRFGYAKKGPRDRDYLTIPRFWKGMLVGLKYRALDGIDDGYKWVQEPASKADFIYLADLAPIDTTSTLADSVSVYEGELDTALALSMGFNAVGIFGTSGAPQLSRASKTFRESIALLKQRYAHVHLVGDQGPGEETSGVAAMRRMKEHIRPSAFFTMLPPNEHGQAVFKDLGEAMALNVFGNELQIAMRKSLELSRNQETRSVRHGESRVADAKGAK